MTLSEPLQQQLPEISSFQQGKIFFSIDLLTHWILPLLSCSMVFFLELYWRWHIPPRVPRHRNNPQMLPPCIYHKSRGYNVLNAQLNLPAHVMNLSPGHFSVLPQYPRVSFRPPQHSSFWSRLPAENIQTVPPCFYLIPLSRSSFSDEAYRH